MDDYAQHPHFQDNIIAFNGQDERPYEVMQQHVEEEEELDSAGNETKRSMDHLHHRDSSSGKLFVGGISWDTTEETFANYFSKYGEIIDSVIMMDRLSGRPRGFGFVTFADSAVADKVLEEEHVIDGRVVEVKRTVPRENMEGKGVTRTKKIFIGGIPPSFTEDELGEYFSLYGSIVEHQIMLDHKTGRSRGFGFVTFESEDAVEKIFSEGKVHELGGKQVEIKKAEPKRAGGDYGSASKSYAGFGSGAGGYSSAARNGGKLSRGYGGYDTYRGYGGYGSYGGDYGASSAGFYGAFGGYGYGYGFGFGGPMYGAGFVGGGYGMASGYGGMGGYGGSKGYGSGGGSSSKGYESGGEGSGSHGIGKGYGNGGTSMSGRYHPYRK